MTFCENVFSSSLVESYKGAGPLFTHALQSFLAAQCALVGDHIWPSDATEAVLQDPNYDFIVVGAGSAGSVVANRLSEIGGWKVLLVEAGGNPTITTEVPQLFFNAMSSQQDWNYTTQPQERACGSYENRQCWWPRGRVLGGSSSTNIMFYVRGNKADFDEWAACGNTGWSYEEVLPYFKKSENYSKTLSEHTSKYRGTGGYLNVKFADDIQDLEKVTLKSALELGFKYNENINERDQMGVTLSDITIKDGVRQSTARAFLSPIKNKRNLQVIKNTLVTKVLFLPHSNIVSGVVLNKDGFEFVVHTRKEVILSAGAINTPQIMLLSGLGPRNHLEHLEINVKANLAVGKNLQDHVHVPTYFTLPGDSETNSLPNIIENLAEYMSYHNGSLSTVAPSRVTAFHNTTDPNAESPDVQYIYLFYPPNSKNLVQSCRKQHYSEEFCQKFHELNKNNFVLCVYTILLKPESRGYIHLQSDNPSDKPLLFPNYLQDQKDLNVLLTALKQVTLKLGETAAFKKAGLKLHWLELDACKNIKNYSDDFLDCMVRELSTTLFHPVGTAKMGPENDETAVVTPELKVRKVERLRVIDASVMHTIVSGNTNAATIMIAEKGADMIKEQWLEK